GGHKSERGLTSSGNRVGHLRGAIWISGSRLSGKSPTNSAEMTAQTSLAMAHRGFDQPASWEQTNHGSVLQREDVHHHGPARQTNRVPGGATTRYLSSAFARWGSAGRKVDSKQILSNG